jgi:hypothetical protein
VLGSQDTPLTFQEYKQSLQDLMNSDGWQVMKKFEHLALSFYVFKANNNELIKSIEDFKRPSSIVLWDILNKEQMEHFLKEVTRQLHNFVASAKTLVDHTRKLTREMYQGTEFLEEFDSEVTQRFRLNPLVQFVHKLRDYVLHRALPVTSATLGPDLDASIRISIKDMRSWDGWNSVAREFVNNAKDEEHIESIIGQYSKLILSFYEWFEERHTQLNKPVFEETEQIRQRLVRSKWHRKI